MVPLVYGKLEEKKQQKIPLILPTQQRRQIEIKENPMNSSAFTNIGRDKWTI